MMRHRSDPETSWRMIGPLGKLVAQGLIGRDEVRAALAAAPAPGADRSGWRARREWRLADAEAAWRRERELVRHAMARALQPLLAARAPRAVLEAAAAEADPRGALRRWERDALLHAHVSAALAARPAPRPARGR